MTKYKILIFDLDDTLVDDLENTRHAYAKMLESIGEAYTDDGYQRWHTIDKKFWRDRQDNLIEVPARFQHETDQKSPEFLDWLRAQRVLIYFNHQISLEKAIELNNLYMSSLTEFIVEIAGAHDTLQYLKDKYRIVIATNGPKVATRAKLSKIGCLDYASEVLSADMFGYMKPKKEFFDAIQNLLGNHNNADYLMIGDSLKSDVGFAMNCHFGSCWFNRNKEKLPDQYLPTIIIESLGELRKVL